MGTFAFTRFLSSTKLISDQLLLSENLNNCVVCILQKYIFYIDQLNVNNYS